MDRRSFFGAAAAAVVGCTENSPSLVPVSVSIPRRLAILVDILDPSESWFGTAELYLAIQSSRFPGARCVLVPLNDGVRTQVLPVPFENEVGDSLIFELLDDDELNDQQAASILKVCKYFGYCVMQAGKIYKPVAPQIVLSTMGDVIETIAELAISECQHHKFDNFGKGEYIVPSSIPTKPALASRLTLLDENRYGGAQVRVYDESYGRVEASRSGTEGV